MDDRSAVLAFAPEAELSLATALVGVGALFSTAWLGPVLAVLSLLLAAYAWSRATNSSSKSMLVMAIAFAVVTLCLSWMGPDVHRIIWG